jgi:hypothetical protein
MISFWRPSPRVCDDSRRICVSDDVYRHVTGKLIGQSSLPISIDRNARSLPTKGSQLGQLLGYLYRIEFKLLS